MAEPKEIDYKTIPVYPYGGAAAAAKGEIELHDTSRWADRECRDAIAAYYWHRRGANLPADAVRDILERFGAERVAFVLANEILLRFPDNGISRSNQDWARVIPAFCPLYERWHPGMGMQSHELDAFITKARQAMGRIPALEEKATELKAIPVYPHSMMDAIHSNELGVSRKRVKIANAHNEASKSAKSPYRFLIYQIMELPVVLFFFTKISIRWESSLRSGDDVVGRSQESIQEVRRIQPCQAVQRAAPNPLRFSGTMAFLRV